MTRNGAPGPRGIVGCVQGVEMLDLINMVHAVWFFCLWRPGGAFFQIGLGCVMSNHQSPHKRALYIPVQILAGNFKMEFLPTV